MNINIEKIFNKYKDSVIFSVSPLGDGHINDTFLLETDDGKYVMQRVVSRLDVSKSEYNYGLYSGICEEEGWSYPVWLKNKKGDYFTEDNEYHWRLYRFIKGEILDTPIDDKILYACGQGLARMHMIFGRIKEEPKAVYPHLHDLNFYYNDYFEKLKRKDLCNENQDPELEKEFAARIESMLAIQPGNLSVVHGDAKLANILFLDGQVIGFIDFDTIMMGFLPEDVADCIRSCCIENDKLNKEKAHILIEGYKSIASETIVNSLENILKVFDKICFELALRYYTDAISKDKIFKEKYPGYRLDRARSLLAVLDS